LKVESWIWNLNDDYPGVNNDDSQLPIGRACLKTHESSRWFSAAQLAGYIDTYRQQGIEFSARCVPTGLTDDAALAISVLNDMRAAGIAEPWLQMDVEVEPTQYFWKGTPAQLEGVFSRIRSACPWAKLILCTYQFDEATYGISRLIPYIDWIATMSYWNDFRTAPELRLQYEVSQLARHGKPIQFGLPGNVAAGEMTRALRWLDPRGGLEIPPIIWRRGTTTLETWNAIAAYQMQWQPPAPPKPEPDPVPPPPPDPTQPTVEQVQLGLIDKIVHQDYATAYADLGKIVGG
jgi:hypothetical protein